MSNKKKKVVTPPPIQLGPFSPRIAKIFQDELNKNEIQAWVARWKSLQPSPKRDMTIKIWSNIIKK